MSVHSEHTKWVSATAMSWRVLVHRFSFLLFLMVSASLLVIGHNRPTLVEHMRTRVVDGLSPALSVFSVPMEMANSFRGRIESYRNLMAENEKLRADNASLVRWQNAALALANENKDLRQLLHYKAEPSLAYISARVIADTGSSFVRSLVVTAGKTDGVHEGMAAITGDGLIGRVVEAGEWSSRVLLMTDMNSRIPVMISGSGDHAILAGDNSSSPKLRFLSQDANYKVGDRVMTSGHGGIFPPNLPVGVIAEVDANDISIAPMAALGRINQIRLIDFNLKGGPLNPMTAKIRAHARTR